jgi:Sulfotransferase family
MARRPILVTGSHRSGTGWVGGMIAACRSSPVAYVWEPFSPLHRPGTFSVHFPYWFAYVCPENEGPFLEPVGDMLAFRYQAAAEFAAVQSVKDAIRLPRDWLRFIRYRRAGARPLLKDPIAIFSAEWLCDTFDMDVIVLIRHPAGFASSLKSRGLTHPFSHFLEQPMLMRDRLAPFRGEITRFAAEPQPLLQQAILLWKLIYWTILNYRGNRPDWMFLRLEDIALNPQTEFEKIYRRLGLTYDEHVRRTVGKYSDPSNPAETPDPALVKRDSRASIGTWRERLDAQEIQLIRKEVEPISKEFYSDSDWHLNQEPFR